LFGEQCHLLEETEKRAYSPVLCNRPARSERTYRKFINAGKFYGVNVIVMVEISPEINDPDHQEANGHYRATLQAAWSKSPRRRNWTASWLVWVHLVSIQDHGRGDSTPCMPTLNPLINCSANSPGKAGHWVDLAEERLTERH